MICPSTWSTGTHNITLKKWVTLGLRKCDSVFTNQITRIKLSTNQEDSDSCCCCIQTPVDEPGLLAVSMDPILLVPTEEDYFLKGMHLAICRSRQHHSLY